MNTTEKLVCAFLVILVGVIMLLGPIIEWNSAGVVQKQLNEQCGTNYSQMDVLLSSEKLTKLCKIKNQEFLIKQ